MGPLPFVAAILPFADLEGLTGEKGGFVFGWWAKAPCCRCGGGCGRCDGCDGWDDGGRSKWGVPARSGSGAVSR
jgi:hypothetical protein